MSYPQASPRAKIPMMHWHRTFLWFLFWALIASVWTIYFQNAWGWGLLAVGTGLVMTWRRYQAAKVAAWVKSPTGNLPPKQVGPWVDVVAELQHFTNVQAQLVAKSKETTDAIVLAAQALPVGVVALDPQFKIDWFNHSAQQHLNLNQTLDIGQSLLNLLRQPDFIQYARRPKWPEPILQKLTQDGSTKHLVMQLVQYAGNQRLLITRDVTQIDRLETMRRDFVANVSHELRTPLTVLSGFLETLKDAPPNALSDEQKHHYISLMFNQSHRMQTIVAELLTLSDLEASSQAERVDLDMPLLIETVRQQAESLSAGKHHFEWHITPHLHLQGSHSELTSACSNLLSNAIRYTPHQGNIKVEWGIDPTGHPTFSVTDTGIGIAPEHIPRLSERFYRVDRGRSRELGGTGLGLAITKHIALRHNAKLEISSKLSLGSCFSLVFDTSPYRKLDKI
jgi:two-component system phosphate regulon sensor histidine kinase PhoR